MLVLINCKKCLNNIGEIHYNDHYFCDKHYGYFICIDCYDKGQTTHNDGNNECNQRLKFHSASETKKWQSDNNIMF